MANTLRSVAVLGAGTMGAQIAAHFANAGVPVVLLDLTDQAARDGLKRARARKPDPLFSPDAVSLMETGGFDRDLRYALRQRGRNPIESADATEDIAPETFIFGKENL